MWSFTLMATICPGATPRRTARWPTLWIVFRLEENRFDDIHEIPPIPHAVPLRLKRFRFATYAVGKVGASSHQMTRGEKQRDNQEKADSAGDSGCTMKRFLLAILRRAKAGQSYVCAVMAGLVPVIQVLPFDVTETRMPAPS